MAAADDMEQVRSLMSGVKVPANYDKVYKDECVFTFDTPFSAGGLCVNLKSLQGVAADLIDLDISRTGCQGGLYLVQKFRRVAKELAPDAGGEAAQAPTKLAIGTPGGFAVGDDKWNILKEYELLAVSASGQRKSVKLPCVDLPTIVSQSVDAVIAHQGASSMDNVSRWEADQDVKDSKYFADLVQLTPTTKISPNPKDWKCEKHGATDNLWLNLSDGYIGGGRKNWDGSGGSNGGLEHFEEEKAKGNFFPLVVKLGTITPQGADIFSYAPDENDLVKDPKLAEHLKHWGIDIMTMEKTDKTMAEMEVDLNANYDWSQICETGAQLVRIRRPGYVGLKNLGNSCYMNSFVQLFASIKEVRERYIDVDFSIRQQAPGEVATDLVTQTSKLVTALNSERYAPPWEEGTDEDDPTVLVAPQMFRSLIGRNHSEFSSGRQQDAEEFARYFFEQLARSERTALGERLRAGKATSNLFEFAVESRLQEVGGKRRVKYSRERESTLRLPVKIEDAENLAEVLAAREAGGGEAKKAKTGEEQDVKAIISHGAALARYAAPEDGISLRGLTFTKTIRMATMPKCLFICLARYYVNEQWIPTKLDAKIPMPLELDLEHLRGKGLQPGETALAEDEAPAAAAAPAPAGPVPDEAIVTALADMGIGPNAAARAALAVQNANAEMAASWYFEHMEDANVNDPLPEAAPATGGGGGDDVDPEQVMMLASMGFTEPQVTAVLKHCGGNAERAADWLFSHMDSLDADIAALSSGGGGGGGGGASDDLEDGKGEYVLCGFISHIGKNVTSGHYVCHRRDLATGEWAIFDDQKVAKSEAPPLDLGYIYLYRRKDTV